jgi:ketosteroid isomerase-like protein
MRRSFADLRAYDITTHAMVEDGPAIATWRPEGTTAGKPRPYRNTYISMIQARDGRIDRYREYFDPLASLRAFDRG